MTRGRLPQRAGSLGLNGGGAVAVVPRDVCSDCLWWTETHHVITADVSAGRHQTNTAMAVGEYGWTMWIASAQRCSLVTATTEAGVVMTVYIVKTLPCLATMQLKLVWWCILCSLCCLAVLWVSLIGYLTLLLTQSENISVLNRNLNLHCLLQ